jgi:hypothetical protein
MQYRLRTLVALTGILPPVLAVLYWYHAPLFFAIVWNFFGFAFICALVALINVFGEIVSSCVDRK